MPRARFVSTNSPSRCARAATHGIRSASPSAVHDCMARQSRTNDVLHKVGSLADTLAAIAFEPPNAREASKRLARAKTISNESGEGVTVLVSPASAIPAVEVMAPSHPEPPSQAITCAADTRSAAAEAVRKAILGQMLCFEARRGGTGTTTRGLDSVLLGRSFSGLRRRLLCDETLPRGEAGGLQAGHDEDMTHRSVCLTRIRRYLVGSLPPP